MKWWFTMWWFKVVDENNGADRWIHSWVHHREQTPVLALFRTGYDQLGDAENDWEDAISHVAMGLPLNGKPRQERFFLEITYGPERPARTEGPSRLAPLPLDVQP